MKRTLKLTLTNGQGIEIIGEEDESILEVFAALKPILMYTKPKIGFYMERHHAEVTLLCKFKDRLDQVTMTKDDIEESYNWDYDMDMISEGEDFKEMVYTLKPREDYP